MHCTNSIPYQCNQIILYNYARVFTWTWQFCESTNSHVLCANWRNCQKSLCIELQKAFKLFYTCLRESKNFAMLPLLWNLYKNFVLAYFEIFALIFWGLIGRNGILLQLFCRSSRESHYINLHRLNILCSI